MHPDTFPLPKLGPKLQQAAVDVHGGKGFVVIRGINPDGFTPEENALIFLGISSYIGDKRGRQDEEGNMLGKSLTCLVSGNCIGPMTPANPTRSPYQRREALKGASR